jgi:DNA-binding IclR family transcriptional regulator
MSYHFKKQNDFKPSTNFVQTIERVNQLLEILGDAPLGLSLGELAATVNLPKGTTHRLISSLAYCDCVRQDPTDRQYELGFNLAVLDDVRNAGYAIDN